MACGFHFPVAGHALGRRANSQGVRRGLYDDRHGGIIDGGVGAGQGFLPGRARNSVRGVM